VNVELDHDECVGTMLYISLEGKLSLLQALLVNSWKVKREVHGATRYVSQQAWVGRDLGRVGGSHRIENSPVFIADY
jgi:hypothetical protein